MSSPSGRPGENCRKPGGTPAFLFQASGASYWHTRAIALTTKPRTGCEARLLPYDASMRNNDPNKISRRTGHWFQPAREEILVLLIAGGAAVVYVVLAVSVNLAF